MLAQFVYEAGAWEVDGERRELRAHGRAVPIGSRAFEIVEKLARSAGQFVSKEELVAHVWRGAVVEENTIRVHIHAIRKALGPDRTLLNTASGRGYRLLGRWTAKQANDSRADRSIDTQPLRQVVRDSLPAAVSDMIGRGPVLLQLLDLVSAFRMVTLTGPGGIGKTALALELVRTLTGEFDRAVCVVDLSSLADAALVASTVATVLGLNSLGNEVTPDHIARAIGQAKLLLLLDNCEHVIGAAAIVAEAIIQRCPHVSLLATSREVLKIAGEHVFRVPALEIPDPDDQKEHLSRRSAVELFVARTQALDSRFTLSSTNASAVALICRRLDGIPLAIEFAAARAATLGVHQVAAGLRDRFGLLISPRRSALPRHRTLRATLDWSYQLLSDAERAFLRRIAIFAGSFTLDDAAAITETAGAIEWLADLVDKSLVVAEPRGSIPLYKLLDTTRVYALEKLAASGESDAVSRRHAKYYREIFERAEHEFERRATGELLADYAWRINNLRAAIEWGFSETGDSACAVALTAAALPLWMHMSQFEECRRRIEQALAALADTVPAEERHEMRLLSALGTSLMEGGGSVSVAEASWERALLLARSTGNVDYELRSLWGLWLIRDKDALDIARQFSVLATSSTSRMLGDRMMAISHHYRGNQVEARGYLSSPTSSLRMPLPPEYRFMSLERPLMARILWLQGYPEQAAKAAAQAVEEETAYGQVNSLCLALVRGACPVALWIGDLELSRRYIDLLNEQSANHALTRWRHWGRCFQGMLMARQGDVAGGLNFIRAGVGEISAENEWRKMLIFLPEMASMLGRSGRLEDGIAEIELALDRSERTAEGWIRPELRRVKGELLTLRNTPGAKREAETCFQEALEEARAQGALAWELRAAASLARLMRDEGRTTELADILGPIYGRFTEGFTMPDLREARALLDGL
ncbi:MAG: winged helix-turn-helix domain-containing protein [Alphaproteobacteria bacterium]|nr:winged helix-turn-helix domain-containing protein [Alphaproteobacteria bacterium]